MEPIADKIDVARMEDELVKSIIANDRLIKQLKQRNDTLYKKWIQAESRLSKFEELYELPGLDLIPKSMRDEYVEEQIKAYNAKPKRGDHSTNRERMEAARKVMRQDIRFRLSIKPRSKPSWVIEHDQEIKEIFDRIDADVEIKIAGNGSIPGVDYE